jgi:hypothetical protein
VQPGRTSVSPAEEKVNVLQVRLPTNFKAARFESDAHTALLRRLAVGHRRCPPRNARRQRSTCQVKLRVYDSAFVPLAKWAMLLAGNYRCVGDDSVRSIKDAVHSPTSTPRVAGIRLGRRAVRVARRRGERSRALRKVRELHRSCCRARRPRHAALAAGTPNIERTDRLVQTIAAQKGRRNDTVDETVARVDRWLARNRKTAEATHAR